MTSRRHIHAGTPAALPLERCDTVRRVEVPQMDDVMTLGRCIGRAVACDLVSVSLYVPLGYSTMFNHVAGCS